MSQVKLFHSARLATDKNYIHTDFFFQQPDNAENKRLVRPGLRIMPRAVRVDYAEN
jgi:hypothetical protein